ncbi:serine hydrolase [uncultured Eudoraea sp.]|uniref:serine hydrolase domain-containing protein n=1 Tax=uncultured Eudoraea sp. TaxID=1035614 RepID=UPI00262FFE2A|nr:serine hydrolase domain-containing protein [uncultured Eudoraea sp.]
MKVDKYVNSYVKSGDFSGCIAIKKGVSILYSNCFGEANKEFNIDNNFNTKFKIGSVSKQFTAIAILLLEERGLLKTNDALTKFYPEVVQLNKTTIEHLLTHQSGLIDIYEVKGFNSLSCKKSSSHELVKEILKKDLKFKSGESYSYSNGGYLILADIIEKVSKRSYEEFLRNELFEPLNMNATGHTNENEIINNLAYGYEPKGYSDFENTIHVNNQLFKGSGSIYSNLSDMFIWIDMLKNRSFLSPKSFEKFFNNYGNAYGYGISIYNFLDKQVFGHDGRVSGYIADYLHYVKDDVTILILGNVQTGVSDFLRRDLALLVFNRDYKTSAKTVLPAKTYEKPINSYVGSYSFGSNFVVHIENFNGVLHARANEGSYSELIPLEDNSLFSRVLYAKIKFEQNSLGEIEKMIWINNDGNEFIGYNQKI